MNKKEMEEQVIKNYERDEQMMVFIFAQWCVNNDLDPAVLYKQAYPQQSANEALQQAIDLTVSKEEAGEILDDTLLNVLSLYGNDELAFIVTEEIGRRKRR
ncbi:hypothetical protein F9802_11305 [Bacillus aerolatus]|uniref:Uncharacterized protein n=1 Tax=Bacillus aerolatus TaxID=2653354 RepID=A0A6I1FPG0_9BACI|nr:hypothetical protein [Bacillus aerolatus]KAB7706170.1 hypothetical protein F9802_11305 [Bacillus aerolatus]